MSHAGGGSQIATLLETVPGIASVLRSPVADALVNTIRAALGTAELRPEDINELVQYATRRGLVGADEGERLAGEVQIALAARASRAAAPKVAPPRRKPAPAKAARKPSKPPVSKKTKAKKRR
jgi:hypothetical protein